MATAEPAISPARLPQHWLYVEDNDSDAALVSYVLEQLAPGVRLTTVNDGDEALRLLQQGNWPDLILLDLQMSRLEGYEVLQSVRALPEGKDIPIVVFSGYDNPETIESCYQLGASAYIVKPDELDQLAEILKAIAASYRRAKPAPSL